MTKDDAIAANWATWFDIYMKGIEFNLKELGGSIHRMDVDDDMMQRMREAESGIAQVMAYVETKQAQRLAGEVC